MIKTESTPQIDYHAWKKRLEGESQKEELERLKRLYLKSEDNAQSEDARENLSCFYEKGISTYTSKLKINPAVPEKMQELFRRDLSVFNRTAAKSLADAADNKDYAISMVPESVFSSCLRLSNIISTADQRFCNYIALESEWKYKKFLYVSYLSDNSCAKCEGLHGRIFTLEELGERDVIPPLHPNCKCKLFVIDRALENMYNFDSEGFLRRLERYCKETSISDGGVYALSDDFLSGFSAQPINLLTLSAYPGIVDGKNSTPKWYEGIREWAQKFGSDFAEFADAFFNRGAELFANADDAMDQNPLVGLLSWADALTFGIVSGMYEGFIRNYEVYQDKPNVYNFLNLYTHGLVEMVDNAFFPEEPLSFEHVLNIIGVATLLFGAAKAIQRAGAAGLDDAARVAVGEIPDTLEDVARRNGKIVEVLSADDLNALLRSKGYYDSYLQGTEVFLVELKENKKFARIYGGRSKQNASWIMYADDIDGLTTEQIREKFALPNTNSMEGICDVILPKGTKIEISYVAPAFDRRGGGVQYKITEDIIPKTWFINERTFCIGGIYE